MGIVTFADIVKTEYQIQETSLKKQHLDQPTEYNINIERLAKLKNNIRNKNCNVIQKSFKF